MQRLTPEQGRTLKMDIQLVGSLIQELERNGTLEALGNPVRPEPPRWQAELARRRERKARR